MIFLDILLICAEVLTDGNIHIWQFCRTILSALWRMSQIGENNLVVGSKYRFMKKIGRGSFGEIYRGIDTTSGQEVAMKCEPIHARNQQLLGERTLYKLLEGGKGFPTILWYGNDLENNIMVMDLLGPSLEDLFQQCGKKFTLKTVLLLAGKLFVNF